ncbi:MAG: DUF4912 domain-containing protein [Candidatus Tectomicrobia bacterium]|uniref:DUF4912 domain-containing protein n=1 Tax=Tectimicrobiota bacterium TaxID=2528274 RepID=A0A932M1M2_UNCTE|nr:DUF4912 domain-containing protein [Candidatus Tectomicrobia bacterium]
MTRKDLQNLARREAAKSPAASPPPPVLRAEEEAFLPEAYGETRLVLMPVDPFWVHAYWELSAQDARKMSARTERGAGQARWILRVYDVTWIQFDGSNAHSSFNVEISPSARNWYINLWSPQKSLCAELGLVAPDGTFFPLTRSNVAHTPAAWISPNTEESWMKVDWRPEAALQPHSLSGMPLPMLRGEPEGSASEVLEPDLPEGVGQKKLISPEEYHRFLEGTPRRNRSGKEQTTSSALKLSPLEMAARSFESGLSSHGLIRNPSMPTDPDQVS